MKYCNRVGRFTYKLIVLFKIKYNLDNQKTHKLDNQTYMQAELTHDN